MTRAITIALVATTTILTGGLVPVLAQELEPLETPPLPAPVSFPHEIAGEQGTVVVHTPQIDAWPNFESAEAGYLSTTMLIWAHNGPGRIIQ